MTDLLQPGPTVRIPDGAPEVPDWAPAEFAHHWDRDLGLAPISTDRYWSREYYDLEVDRVWARSWQMACWESDIPDAGDTIVYDIGPLSFIVLRTPSGEIKAHYNACLHRGARLVESAGPLKSIRCPYHAWTWNLDGSLKHVPGEWDFPLLDKAEACLPEAKVDTWGGFVFINPDPDAIALERWLAPIPEYTNRYWPMARRSRVAHVQKIIPANWKLVYGANIEVYHTPTLHPQLGARQQSGNGKETPFRSFFQFDFWDLTSRLACLDSTNATVPGRSSPYPTVPPPDSLRTPLAERLGVDPERLAPEETLGKVVNYHAFPNLLLGVVAVNYTTRVRPYDNDPGMSVMDLWVTRHLADDEEMPPPPETHFLGVDDPFTEALEIVNGGVDPIIYEQDMWAIGAQQRSIRSLPKSKRTMTPGAYQEICVRHHNDVLDRFISQP